MSCEVYMQIMKAITCFNPFQTNVISILNHKNYSQFSKLLLILPLFFLLLRQVCVFMYVCFPIGLFIDNIVQGSSAKFRLHIP